MCPACNGALRLTVAIQIQTEEAAKAFIFNCKSNKHKHKCRWTAKSLIYSSNWHFSSVPGGLFVGGKKQMFNVHLSCKFHSTSGQCAGLIRNTMKLRIKFSREYRVAPPGRSNSVLCGMEDMKSQRRTCSAQNPAQCRGLAMQIAL